MFKVLCCSSDGERIQQQKGFNLDFFFLNQQSFILEGEKRSWRLCLSAPGKSIEEMDRRWMIGTWKDGSHRWCWLDGWLLHGNVGAQLCVQGGVWVVTELAAPGGPLVTLPVTCGTQKALWGQFQCREG